MQKLRFYDDNTRSWWEAATGGLGRLALLESESMCSWWEASTCPSALARALKDAAGSRAPACQGRQVWRVTQGQQGAAYTKKLAPLVQLALHALMPQSRTPPGTPTLYRARLPTPNPTCSCRRRQRAGNQRSPCPLQCRLWQRRAGWQCADCGRRDVPDGLRHSHCCPPGGRPPAPRHAGQQARWVWGFVCGWVGVLGWGPDTAQSGLQGLLGGRRARPEHCMLFGKKGACMCAMCLGGVDGG